MTERYHDMENKILELERIRDTELIIGDLQDQGIEINDIDGIVNESSLKVSNLFSSVEDRLYLNQDIYNRLDYFVDEVPVMNYKSSYELEEQHPVTILEHFMQSKPIKEMTDIDLISSVYGEQTKETYRKLKRVVDLANLKKIPIPTELLMQLPMINKEQIIYDYDRMLDLYFNKHIDFTLVALRTKDGHEYSHIKLEILETGEVVYKVNANPGKISTEWICYLAPIHVIGDLMNLSLKQILVLDVEPKDLIYSKKRGKLSGVMIGSKLDMSIYEYLNIDNLYRQGIFTRFQEPDRLDGNSTEVSILNWT